ncbi:hypothetical protein LSAT2_020068 [Lamellibrachia satsuma]|nr:hypothetical protein LSAT2_020068 [Lamellibrachia satsuma]
MIAPNEEKRRSIMEKAKAEEANYRQYKENQKMGYVSCGGTVGGASCDAPPASLLRKQRNSTFNSKQKSQQYRDGEKRQEAEEINRKKLQQRRKAESNDRQEAERQERLRQDHRRVNSAFLRNLERH